MEASMCTFCKIVGHELEKCPKRPKVDSQSKPTPAQPLHYNPNAPFPKAKPGMHNEWITVNRKKPNVSDAVPEPLNDQLDASNPEPMEAPLRAVPDDDKVASPNAFGALDDMEEDAIENANDRDVDITEAQVPHLISSHCEMNGGNGQKKGISPQPSNRILSLDAISHSYP